MIIDYLNDLREKGVDVIQEDTIWIDTFCSYVIKNKIISKETLNKALSKTIKLVQKGQTTKEVIELLKAFSIDYEPIEEAYKISLTDWKGILEYGK